MNRQINNNCSAELMSATWSHAVLHTDTTCQRAFSEHQQIRRGNSWKIYCTCTLLKNFTVYFYHSRDSSLDFDVWSSLLESQRNLHATWQRVDGNSLLTRWSSASLVIQTQLWINFHGFFRVQAPKVAMLDYTLPVKRSALQLSTNSPPPPPTQWLDG